MFVLVQKTVLDKLVVLDQTKKSRMHYNNKINRFKEMYLFLQL
jgi:hypothetical protein